MSRTSWRLARATLLRTLSGYGKKKKVNTNANKMTLLVLDQSSSSTSSISFHSVQTVFFPSNMLGNSVAPYGAAKADIPGQKASVVTYQNLLSTRIIRNAGSLRKIRSVANAREGFFKPHKAGKHQFRRRRTSTF